MPNFTVDNDKTNQSSQSLKGNFAELEKNLQTVRGNIEGLLEDAYKTPAAEAKFRPFYDDFERAFRQVNESLDNISSYIQGVGDTFAQADESTGSKLNK